MPAQAEDILDRHAEAVQFDTSRAALTSVDRITREEWFAGLANADEDLLLELGFGDGSPIL
ncbi:MAG: hypothetical protein WD070_03250 [Pirellulaceae bacterium]